MSKRKKKGLLIESALIERVLNGPWGWNFRIKTIENEMILGREEQIFWPMWLNEKLLHSKWQILLLMGLCRLCLRDRGVCQSLDSWSQFFGDASHMFRKYIRKRYLYGLLVDFRKDLKQFLSQRIMIWDVQADLCTMPLNYKFILCTTYYSFNYLT